MALASRPVQNHHTIQAHQKTIKGLGRRNPRALAQNLHEFPLHQLRVRREGPKRLIHDSAIGAKAAQRCVVARGGVEAVLHDGRLDGDGGVELGEFRCGDIGDAEVPDSVRDVGFGGAPGGESLSCGGERGVED